MKPSMRVAAAAAVLIPGCSGAEKSTSPSRARADAEASDGSRIAYQEFTNWYYCPCDYSTGGTCDTVCYSYSSAGLMMASSDGTGWRRCPAPSRHPG